MSVPMTVSDLEKRDATGQNFLADYLNNARTVLRRITKFGRMTWEGRISSKWAGPSASQLWGFPSIYAYTL